MEIAIIIILLFILLFVILIAFGDSCIMAQNSEIINLLRGKL